jgi:hypothetical protein
MYSTNRCSNLFRLEVEFSVGKTLVALDTNHIKSYVFATNKLKEIRGASSLLDRLNRDEMERLARTLDPQSELIYANGGSGLFLIESHVADKFGKKVQERYRELTAGGATITYIVQELPADTPTNIVEIMEKPLGNTLALMRYRLREAKGHPPLSIATPSHPLMRPCDFCGTFYAEESVTEEGENYLCCQSCLRKRKEDQDVKTYIDACIAEYAGMLAKKSVIISPLWKKLLNEYLPHYNYHVPLNADRPSDFNYFSRFRGTKDYIGLIYADANGMGQKIGELTTLQATKDFATHIDETLYWTMAEVISEHLRIGQHDKSDTESDGPIFPFDILLMGGDDIVLVTPGSIAMTVAHALAEKFYVYANKKLDELQRPKNEIYIMDKQKQHADETFSLSIGVVLAPIKYPFGLLLDLAEDTLKFAKQDSTKTKISKKSNYGKTRINFIVVAGSTSHSFERVYAKLHKDERQDNQREFYATMRPYTVEQLGYLLHMLAKGNQLALGRSKLHQLREAILQQNLSTSIVDSLAVLRSWKNAKQREFVVRQVSGDYPQWNEQQPAASFSSIEFPWHVDMPDGRIKRYSTPLLDFVELYDFVAEVDGDKEPDDDEL